jgi:hypothetical protein
MANRLTSSITPASLSHLAEASVAVCAHDAGAASHLAAWLAPHQQQLRPCLEGPARSLFTARLGPLPQHSLAECLEGACLLISGSGWSSDLEHKARALARRRGIPSVAVLDHWVNYRARFERGGEEVLPDQLWVADAEAQVLAQATFPALPVLQLPNQWLTELSQAVASTRPQPPQQPARRLLYLMEPIRVPWPGGPWKDEQGELQALRYLLEQLPKLAERGCIAPRDQLEALALRPHPSEPAGKYDALIADAVRHLPIRLDPTPSLAVALAWADATFGCETQALVAALACGLPAFSTVPPWAPPCRLPQAALQQLSRMEEL